MPTRWCSLPIGAALVAVALLAAAPTAAQGTAPVAARFGDLAACLAAPDRTCLIGAAIATAEGTP